MCSKDKNDNPGPIFENLIGVDKLSFEVVGKGNEKEISYFLLIDDVIYAANVSTKEELETLIASGEAARGEEVRMNAKHGLLILIHGEKEVFRTEASSIPHFEAEIKNIRYVIVPLLGLNAFQVRKNPTSVSPYPTPKDLEDGFKGSDLRITSRGLSLYSKRKVSFSTLPANDVEIDWKYGRDPKEEAQLEDYIRAYNACDASFITLSALRGSGRNGQMETPRYIEAQASHDKLLAALDVAEKNIGEIEYYLREML